MYYPVLKELKGYRNLNENDLNVYDTVLYRIFKNIGENRFGARAYKIAYENLDYQKWLTFLLVLSEKCFARVNYELTCPNCFNSVEVYSKYDKIPFGDEYSCRICGEDFEIDESLIYLSYNILPSLKPTNGDDEASADFFPESKKEVIDKESFTELLEKSPDILYGQIVMERNEELVNLLKATRSALTNDEKKKSLEFLSERVFQSPYLKVHSGDKRTRTGELDRVFRVSKIPGTIFFNFSDLLLLESKNWDDKMTTSEVRVFSGKLNDAKIKVGIIVSKNGLTGKIDSDRDAWGIVKKAWDSNEIRMLVFCLNEIEAIISGEINTYSALEDKYIHFHLMA